MSNKAYRRIPLEKRAQQALSLAKRFRQKGEIKGALSALTLYRSITERLRKGEY